MALLRPGRCCSHPQGGCLQHRTEARRRPKGQDAGGTPALPGDAVPAVRWGVSGGRLLRKPTCTFGETPVCRRAGRPPCRADHSRKSVRSLLMKTNHECTRIDTKTGGPSSTTSGAKMLLQYCALGVTMSWDEGLLGARASRPHNDGFLGARASRPHQAWHSLGHLPHLDQPGTVPWLSFGLAAAVPADRAAACSIALKLGGGQRDKMRAGRLRSQGMPSRRCGGEWKPGRQAREQGSATIGDVCLSPYRSQPDSFRRNSSGPGDADSGESPLFITFGTVVTVSSAIADRWSFAGCRAWRLRPCREKGGRDVKQTCNHSLRMDG